MKARTTEEYREALLNNLEQVGRLIILTRSLLTLATFTSGKTPLYLVPLPLEPMMQDLVDELTLLADDRRITLSFKSQSIPPVLVDAQWLTQALINLLDNALHHTPSGGAVTVRLQAVGEGVTVAVVQVMGSSRSIFHISSNGFIGLIGHGRRTLVAPDLGWSSSKKSWRPMAEQFGSQVKSTRARSLHYIFRSSLIRQCSRSLSGPRIHLPSFILL